MIKLRGREFRRACLVGFASTTGPQSGKSYTAKQLLHRFSGLCTSRVFSFAARVKELCNFVVKTLTGLDLNNYSKEDYVPGTAVRIRDLYIRVGTDYFRNQVDPDYWVKQLESDLWNYLTACEDVPVLVVLDDLRMMNEYQFVLSSGGRVWDVRDKTLSRNSIKDVETDSLLQPSDFKYDDEVVWNDKTREGLACELANKVDYYVHKHLRGLVR